VKKQFLLAAAGLLLVLALFIFGRTVSKKPVTTASAQTGAAAFSIQNFVTAAKQKLTPNQNITLGKLENSVTRGDVLKQQIAANNQLAAFWKDSAQLFEPYAYYTSVAANLDNSEKNLTFAAQLYLGYLRHEADNGKREWMADEAIKLFDKAIAQNPTEPHLKVDKGACSIYGYAASGKAEKAMSGILMLRDIADKDPSNAEAQLLVGIGGAMSGQYDKAIARLTKVVALQPKNIEAISWLADCYAGAGNKAEAVKWYGVSKKLINNPAYTKEVDQRIKDLK
jgi:tetratricopeptide (TPR) repeat protein